MFCSFLFVTVFLIFHPVIWKTCLLFKTWCNNGSKEDSDFTYHRRTESSGNYKHSNRTDVSCLRKNLTLIAISISHIFKSCNNYKGFLAFDFCKEIWKSIQTSHAVILNRYLNYYLNYYLLLLSRAKYNILRIVLHS